jgi:hypothetical protein
MNRVYGIEIYLITSESTTQNVDYRQYTGAVKNQSGALNMVGVGGFTETLLVRDASLFTTNIAISGTVLEIQITNNIVTNPIISAARIEMISNNLFT